MAMLNNQRVYLYDIFFVMIFLVPKKNAGTAQDIAFADAPDDQVPPLFR